MVPVNKGEFFTEGRRDALSDWSLNLSVVLISAAVVSEAFFKLPFELKAVVIAAGLLFMGFGVFVAPEKAGGN